MSYHVYIYIYISIYLYMHMFVFDDTYVHIYVYMYTHEDGNPQKDRRHVCHQFAGSFLLYPLDTGNYLASI